MSKIIKNFKSFGRLFSRYNEAEWYLSQATSLADLERRQREIQTNGLPTQLYFF